jgi:hypothetical protein
MPGHKLAAREQGQLPRLAVRQAEIIDDDPCSIRWYHSGGDCDDYPLIPR